MTIKELEQILEVPRATIRFYEKEELISPKRSGNAYREYSEEDVILLKKIIILRKIGLSVADIKNLLETDISLQNVLEKNIEEMQEKMKELQGAIKICKMMQEKQERMSSLDEAFYWEEIHSEERAGNKFIEIVNDVVEFEKKVIFDEFGIGDEEGKLKVSPKMAVLIAFASCFGAGLLWFFLDGMNKSTFVEGFFFPLVCIIISSVLGLPVYFIEKKHPEVASFIKKVGKALAVIFVLFLIGLIIWGDI